MSDTRRKNSPEAHKWFRWYNSPFWVEYGIKHPGFIENWKKQEARSEALMNRGADGHNAKDHPWRFLSAREDGSGKLNTFDEVGSGRRNNKAKKRYASKDTRRFGKKIIRKELDDFRS